MVAMAPSAAPNNYRSLLQTDILFPHSLAKKKVVAFSGGKDSLAAVLALLEMGIPPSEIELWHHLIDGAPGSPHRFDWPCTLPYVRAVARTLGVPLRLSWKDGGFEGELFREDAVTKGVYYEDGRGTVRYLPPQKPGAYCKACRQFYDADEPTCHACGEPRDGYGTRRKYPMVTADLSKRWCSAYLKIMVCKRVLTNDPRFAEGYFWMSTGERREESASRAKYKEVERHSSSNSVRTVHQWRNVIDWTEAQVWEIIKRWGIMPHPCYRLGFSRCSCMFCIFGDQNQWATVRRLAPKEFNWHARNERRFSLTIREKESVVQLADRGTPYYEDAPAWLTDLAMSDGEYPDDQLIVPAADWETPLGAYKRCGGPT
jgi:3'-phosphoadenosine 5'-phosphosulfate sulfotransferase (PAPS reductase)/FAD synthetase